MTSQIVELDSDTKALQICGPNGAEVRMGAMADGYVFMQYDGRTFITHARMNPDLYRNKEFDGKHASGAGLSGASAYTVQENVHFLAAGIALMSIPLPDHANTDLQATSRNLIAHSGKQDQPDRISRAREPSPSLSAAPRLNNEPSPRPNLSGHPIISDLELRIRHRVPETQVADIISKN